MIQIRIFYILNFLYNTWDFTAHIGRGRNELRGLFLFSAALASENSLCAVRKHRIDVSSRNPYHIASSWLRMNFFGKKGGKDKHSQAQPAAEFKFDLSTPDAFNEADLAKVSRELSGNARLLSYVIRDQDTDPCASESKRSMFIQ